MHNRVAPLVCVPQELCAYRHRLTFLLTVQGVPQLAQSVDDSLCIASNTTELHHQFVIEVVAHQELQMHCYVVFEILRK